MGVWILIVFACKFGGPSALLRIASVNFVAFFFGFVYTGSAFGLYFR